MTDGMCQKWFATFRAGGFSLEDAPRSGRHVEVDRGQIKTLTENNTLFHAGDSRHTQNIQINNVLGDNETCIFYFTEKTKWTF